MSFWRTATLRRLAHRTKNLDIPSISAALSSLKTAADIAKLIKDSGATLEQAEIKLKIADLVSSLADARIKISEVRESLAEKDAELRTLKSALETRDSLEYEAPYYWLVKLEGKDGPFCQKCYDADAKLARLQMRAQGYWGCTLCNTKVVDRGHKPNKSKSTVVRSNYVHGWKDEF